MFGRFIFLSITFRVFSWPKTRCFSPFCNFLFENFILSENLSKLCLIQSSLEFINLDPQKCSYYPFGGCWINPSDRQIHAKNNNISIIASEKDQKLFFDAIINPPKPNKNLLKAAKNYNKLVASK